MLELPLLQGLRSGVWSLGSSHDEEKIEHYTFTFKQGFGKLGDVQEWCYKDFTHDPGSFLQLFAE